MHLFVKLPLSYCVVSGIEFGLVGLVARALTSVAPTGPWICLFVCLIF